MRAVTKFLGARGHRFVDARWVTVDDEEARLTRQGRIPEAIRERAG